MKPTSSAEYLTVSLIVEVVEIAKEAVVSERVALAVGGVVVVSEKSVLDKRIRYLVLIPMA